MILLRIKGRVPKTDKGEKIEGALSPTYFKFAPIHTLDEQSKQFLIKHNNKNTYFNCYQEFYSNNR